MSGTKKKIAIFHCGFIYSGGGERIVLEEARHLKKRGYEVLVYAPTLKPDKCYPEFVKEIGVKTFLPSFIDSLPLRNALRMVVTSMLAPILAWWFRDVDIFIGANQPGIWIAYCMSTVLGKPYIIYMNQPNRILYPRPVDRQYGWYTTEKDFHVLYKLFRIIKPIFRWLDHSSVKHAKSILVNGSYIGGVIENIYGIRTVEAAAGCYAQPRESLNINPDTKKAYKGEVSVKHLTIKKQYALITNRHDPQKRFDFVINALKYVLGCFPDAKLVIPGVFTQHTPQLIRLTQELNLQNNVIFTGQISELDLQKLYKHATVYCYPSPEEDFGLGPLEAGGWGVPTVAWNHAGPTVTVKHGETGLLATPYNIQEYAKYILKIFQDKSLRVKLGRGAWEQVRHQFSWDKHTDIIEKQLQLVSALALLPAKEGS